MFGHKSFFRLGSFNDPGIKGLQNEGYELMNFTNQFYQDIDERGKVLSGVKGGTISILLDGFPSRELVDWGVEPRSYHSGEIVILDADNNVMEKIRFTEGACVFFKIHYIDRGKAYCATKMIIEAKEIKIGSEVDLHKNWTTES